MIYLKTIYSEPDGLFDKVEFHNGINIIYGEFSKTAISTDSLNSIGKSTLVELIDFTLLAGFDKGSKLYKAKKIMSPYKVVLEFEIGDNTYHIKRSAHNSNDIEIGDNIQSKMYPIMQAKEILFDMFFEDIDNQIEKKEYRKLINLYIRDEKTGFNDVITYVKGLTELKLMPYHLFLLNIKNDLSKVNIDIIKNIDEKGKAKTEIKKIIETTYDIQDIEIANATIANKKEQLDQASKMLEEFKLNDTYNLVDGKIEDIVNLIKHKRQQRYVLKQKSISYKKSLESEAIIDVKKITSIYEELNKSFSVQVSKTLEEAIAFKQNLLESRKEFLLPEIDRIDKSIDILSVQISELDNIKSNLYKTLEWSGGVEDLVSAVEQLNELHKEMNEMIGKLKIYNDIEEQIFEFKQALIGLCSSIKVFLAENKPYIDELRSLYNSIYNNIYSQSGNSIFDIILTTRKKSKISIKTTTSDADGWGKGRGCILVYDLLILILGLQKNLRRPRVLIHDGVFYGVGASQFISVLNYLEELSKNNKFQYIITTKESDVWLSDALKEQYGNFDFDFNEKIVARYSENNKIFKQEF